MRFAVLVEAALRRAHGNDVVEAVAALDAHVVGHRAQAVGGIEIAVEPGVEVAAPQALALVGEELLAEIVHIGAFAVEQIAKQAGVDHAQDGSFVGAVAAILEDHAVAAGLFRGVDELPAVFDGGGGGHFDGGMLAVLHGGNRHLHVPVPGRGDHDQVKVVASHQRFEIVFAVGVELRRSLPCLDHQRLRMLGLFAHDVAKRKHLGVGAEQVFKQVGAAPSGADEADARSGFLEGHIDHGGCMGGLGVVAGRLSMKLCHAYADGGSGADAQKIPARGVTKRFGRFGLHNSHLFDRATASQAGPLHQKYCRDSLYRPDRTCTDGPAELEQSLDQLEVVCMARQRLAKTASFLPAWAS